MEQEKRGQVVVVRDFEKRGFIRTVWEVQEDAVFITSENGFKKLLRGDKDLWPIGVPHEDVYKYEGVALPKVVDWTRMKRWRS